MELLDPDANRNVARNHPALAASGGPTQVISSGWGHGPFLFLVEQQGGLMVVDRGRSRSAGSAHGTRLAPVYDEHRHRVDEAAAVKSKKRILIPIFLLVLGRLTIASPTHAQTSTIRFERISLEEGLSENTLPAILRDRRGFIWFGTQDGLIKYDGHQFTVYKHDPNDPTTLSSNMVYALCEDQAGDLWVGTASGLERFDKAAGPRRLGPTQGSPADAERAPTVAVGIMCLLGGASV